MDLTSTGSVEGVGEMATVQNGGRGGGGGGGGTIVIKTPAAVGGCG